VILSLHTRLIGCLYAHILLFTGQIEEPGRRQDLIEIAKMISDRYSQLIKTHFYDYLAVRSLPPNEYELTSYLDSLFIIRPAAA
jgi:hypothetical protein